MDAAAAITSGKYASERQTAAVGVSRPVYEYEFEADAMPQGHARPHVDPIEGSFHGRESLARAAQRLVVSCKSIRYICVARPCTRPKSSLRDAATTESVRVELSRASSSMAKGALQLLVTLPLQSAHQAMSKHDKNMSVRVMQALCCGNREVMLCQRRSMGAKTADDRPKDS